MNGGTLIQFASAPPTKSPRQRSTNVGANFTFQLANTKSSKKSSNSAEKRANHNAVERARRECLNVKFQDLAQALPSLASIRRPSKSIIVQKSLEFISYTREREILNEKEISSLRSENDDLRKQLNQLRNQIGLPPLPNPIRLERPPLLTVAITDNNKMDLSEDNIIKSSRCLKGNTPKLRASATLGDPYSPESGVFAFDTSSVTSSSQLHTPPLNDNEDIEDDGSISDDNEIDYDNGHQNNFIHNHSSSYTASTPTTIKTITTTTNPSDIPYSINGQHIINSNHAQSLPRSYPHAHLANQSFASSAPFMHSHLDFTNMGFGNHPLSHNSSSSTNTNSTLTPTPTSYGISMNVSHPPSTQNRLYAIPTGFDTNILDIPFMQQHPDM